MNYYKKILELFSIKFARDSVWTMVSHFFVAISGLLINTIVGNHYNAEGLGLFNQALSIYLLLTLVANFGIQTSVQKHASQYSHQPEEIKQIFTAAVIATGGIALAISFVFYGSLILLRNWLSSQELTKIVLVFILAVPLFAINKTINNFLVGLRLIKIYANIRIFRWICVIIGIIIMKEYLIPLQNAGYIFIIIESLILLYFIFRMGNYWGRLRKDWFATHLAFGVKSIMAEFVATFNTRTPILIIGYILGNAAAGYFSYIENFARSILMISGALQKNFNPVFTKLWYEGKIEEIKEKMHRVFKVSLYSLVPVIVGLYMFFYIYTYLFMPKEYLELSSILLVFLIGTAVMYLYSPFSTLLIMTNHLYWNLIRVVFITISTIVLSLLFVRQFHIMGASMAMTLSMFIELISLEILYRRIIRVKLVLTTWRGNNEQFTY